MAAPLASGFARKGRIDLGRDRSSHNLDYEYCTIPKQGGQGTPPGR